MKKKIFDRRGAGVEMAIMMMVVSFSMSILLTSIALIQGTKKVRAEERLQQSIALEQLGQEFLSAVLKGDTDGWISKGGHNKYTTDSHDWVEDETKKSTDATCTTDGARYLICGDCGETKEEKIPALGHSCEKEEPGEDLSEVPGEGTSEDVIVKGTCQECGTEISEDDPVAHHWIESEKKEAACVGVGEIIFVCETCGDTYTEEIPASHTWGDDNKCTLCDETKPFEGKWDDAYDLIVYKNGDGFDVYVTITSKMDDVCKPEEANPEEGANDGDAENAEPAGKQVLVIRVEKVTDAEGNFTYKITEWTKNDRS